MSTNGMQSCLIHDLLSAYKLVITITILLYVSPLWLRDFNLKIFKFLSQFVDGSRRSKFLDLKLEISFHINV